MELTQLKRDLFDTTFLVGGFRQRRALKALAESPEVRVADVLAEALAKNHPRANSIRAVLLAWTPPGDQAKIDRLWGLWSQARDERLGKLLVQLGVPAAARDVQVVSLWKLGRPVKLTADQRSVRSALGWVRDADPDIRRGLAKTIEQVPNDERLNDEIVEAWAKHESSELEALIQKQGRKPARPELEALFYLVTGQAKAYQALQDERGEYFLQAFLMASATFRQRINDTVVKSGNARLVAIYSKAMGGRDGFDRGLYLEALKKAGDEDQLFECLREMHLLESLEHCQRWAETGRLPTHDRRRQAAERAVAAYRGLGQIAVEQGPAPPSGLRDLFAVWEQEPVSEAQQRDDARAADPLRRARALYRGQGAAGAVHSQASPAADSDDWPVRLVARLQDPALAAREDHVQWISALSGIDAAVLQATVAGTPVEYKRFSDLLARARRGGPAAGRGVRLLEILCALQGAFVATDGDWGEDTREATDQRAIDVGEDAPLD